MTLIRDVRDFYAVREWKRKWQQRATGVKRPIESGMGCPAPALSIHPTVYTLSSTINTSWGLGCLPSAGPPDPSRPLWMPNWAYRSPDWINSYVSGTFSPSTKEGDCSTPAWDPGTIPQNRQQGERGLVTDYSKGLEAGVEAGVENVGLSVGKPRLEMWTGGNERSQYSQGQWVPAGM